MFEKGGSSEGLSRCGRPWRQRGSTQSWPANSATNRRLRYLTVRPIGDYGTISLTSEFQSLSHVWLRMWQRGPMKLGSRPEPSCFSWSRSQTFESATELTYGLKTVALLNIFTKLNRKKWRLEAGKIFTWRMPESGSKPTGWRDNHAHSSTTWEFIVN